jgi:hypothetical protein
MFCPSRTLWNRKFLSPLNCFSQGFGFRKNQRKLIFLAITWTPCSPEQPWWLYQLPSPAVTNDHTVKVHYCTVLGACIPQVDEIGLKSRGQQSWVPSGSSKEESISLSFPTFGSWPLPPSSKPAILTEPAHPATSLALPHLPLFYLQGRLWSHWGHPANPN